jgi:hypothetical protein
MASTPDLPAQLRTMLRNGAWLFGVYGLLRLYLTTTPAGPAVARGRKFSCPGSCEGQRLAHVAHHRLYRYAGLHRCILWQPVIQYDVPGSLVTDIATRGR